MRAPLFQVDAFASRPFTGNPAAVIPLERFPDDAVMQAVAAENNLPVTAFLVPESGDYRLRWFTPGMELPLCGHGTLAGAAVVLEKLEPERARVVFHTRSGPLTVKRARARYAMDLPARLSEAVPAPAGMVEASGVTPLEVRVNAFSYLALLTDAQAVREFVPDVEGLKKLDRHAVIVTAAGDQGYDFVSRYFSLQKGVAEDPVTGAAHCMLAPYWAERLGKTTLRAYQASSRGGEVGCRIMGERVELEGACVFYKEGYAEI